MRSIKTREFTEYLIDKHGHDRNGGLLPLTPQVIELLGVDLEKQAQECLKNSTLSFPYFNFWKITLSPQKNTVSLDAAPSNAVARKITKLFNEQGILTEEISTVFSRATSRPNQYIELIKRLSQIAKQHDKIYHTNLQAGRNIAFILNAILEGVLFYCYQLDTEVKLQGWGAFALKNRAKGERALTSLKTLQFTPISTAKIN